MSNTNQDQDKSSTQPGVRRTVQGVLRRYAIGSGVGLTVLATGGLAAPARAAAPPAHFGSPAWFAQKTAAVSAPAAVTVQPARPAAASGGVSTPAQAATQLQQSMQDLNTASNAIRAALANQVAARGAAAAVSVPDGLTAGGLQVASQAQLNAAGGAGTPVTSGIASISQSASGSQKTVTVKQDAAEALVTWSSFNVGAHTTLDFDQSAGTQTNGNNSWAVLNRVLGNPNTTASQILGNIKADGSVYIINQNGILFGPNSQVNTHSFLASTFSLSATSIAQSNNQFLTAGILPEEIVGGPLLVEGLSPLTGVSITISRGAQITAGEQGFVLIDAPQVTNSGLISATDGQAIVAASPGLNATPARNGSEYMTPLVPDVPNGVKAADYTLINNGVIQSVRGNISLIGINVVQDGVVEATTGVTRPGVITIDTRDNTGLLGSGTAPTAGAIDFGSKSVTAILPQEDGQTTTSSPAATTAFQLPSLTFTGGSVTFEPGALVEAPGAALNVAAIGDGGYTPAPSLVTAGVAGIQGRIFVASGATLDVAGLADVELPVSAALVTIGPLTQNDLADSPLLKDGFLYTSTVTVNSALSGTTADGQSWVGSPIIDAAGYIQNIPRKIDQMLVNGGTVNLTGPEVITAQGSSINISGGYVNYLGGLTSGTTRLLAANGLSYDIGSADPDIGYTGFAGVQTVDSTRWNVSQTYVNPVLSGAQLSYMPGFVQGGNGGKLIVAVGGITIGTADSTLGTAILDGTISAGVVAGRNQVASGGQPTGAQFSLGGAVGTPLYNSSFYFNEFAYGPSIDITSGSPDLQQIAQSSGAASFTAATPLPGAGLDPADHGNLQYWSPVNAAALSADGFSSISISSQRGEIVEDAGAALTVKPGGSLATSGSPVYDQIVLTGGAVTLGGRLFAPSGVINVTATGLAGATSDIGVPGNIQVGATAVIDASGQWINDTGRTADQITGSTFINGGSISLATQENSYSLTGTPTVVDNTGSIGLAPGSTLNVSSGGYVGPAGAILMDGNVPAGTGGSISLVTYDSRANVFGVAGNTSADYRFPSSVPEAGSLSIAGASLIGYGFSSGGTLTLQALGIQIGGADAGGAAVVAPETQGGTLYLPSNFFQGAPIKDPQSGTVTTAAGFGSYTLNAEYNATIAGGANGTPSVVAVQEQNLKPNYAALAKTPGGTNLLSSSAVSIAPLDAYDSRPGSFTLTAGDYRNWRTGGVDYGAAGPAGSVLIEQDASLAAAPGSSVLLGSPASVLVLGSVTAHGGSITVDGMSALGLNPVTGDVTSIPAGMLELGPQAVLDVSGTLLINPFVKPVPINGQPAFPVSGTLLTGGSISLYGTNVAAAPGSVLDVSGISAVLDVPQTVFSSSAGRVLALYAPAQEWSDAGQITAGALNSLYLESTVRAQPGSGAGGTGSGGQLTVTALGIPQTQGTPLTPAGQASTVELFQSPDGLAANSPLLLPAGWQPGDPIPSGAGTLYLGAGKLASEGIWNLTINTNGNAAAAASETLSSTLPLTLAFAGNVALSLKGSFTADATTYSAQAMPGDTSGNATTVSLFAPYIALDGYYPIASNTTFAPAALLGSATVNVGNLDPAAGPVTQLIDLGGDFALANIGQANFASRGDIRFLTSASFQPGALPKPGELYTPGNLRFTATELYPASGNSFLILAGGAQDASGNPIPATVDFEATAGSTPSVPLSAGGSLLADASTIVQNGVLWAPSGTIALGVGNPADGATQTLFGSASLVATTSVTLGAGSSTSVSLGGATIPYGSTLDGQEWQYNSNPQSASDSQFQAADLTAPPAKLIEINGATVTLASATQGRAAASIDVSGGGELQAQEWVPGVGGTHDVLSQLNTTFTTSPSGAAVPLYADARGIYALVPSYQAPVAAYDAVFAQGQAALVPGEAITISAGNGIPAGTYVLMPAKYATLPGSYRVVQDSGVTDTTPAQNSTLADGTQLISGYFSNALTGARQSRSQTFEVQSSAVWQQYSQYDLTPADSFFPGLGAQSGGSAVIPPLPVDAGQLVLGASTGLSLGGAINTSAGTYGGKSGAPAQIDIASQDIQITGGSAAALPGYLQLSAQSLNALGAGSLLIGGTRSETADGTLIDPLAQSIVVSNGSSSALQGSQIILVASDTLQVDAGSVIKAAAPGASAAPATPLIIGQSSQAGSGNGALVMVSSGGPAALSRISNSGTGTLSVGAGAQLSGGGFLLLDAAGTTSLDSTATVSGNAITADAASITFVPQATGSTGIPGMVIGPATLAQLAKASQVTLRSYGSVDFEGNLSLSSGSSAGDSLELSGAAFTAGAYGNKGTQVSITAPTLILTNEQALNAQTSVVPATGSAALSLQGTEVDFGSSAGTNPAVFAGFSSINVTASPSVTTGSSSSAGGGVVTRNGSFNFGSVDVSINAPVILAAGNSTTSLETMGTLTLGRSTGTALTAAQGLGGQLTLSAGSISDTATIQAPAGNLTLSATSGDVQAGSGAVLSVAGVAVPFYDINEYAPAGTLTLSSQSGNVRVDSGATLDFAGASAGGDAGSLVVSAPQGSLMLGTPGSSSLPTLLGSAAPAPSGATPYTSGSVSLTVGAAQDLNTLAQALAASGATQSLSVTSGSGGLTLGSGNTLTALNVTLVANGGTVTVDGVIKADGPAGGNITLYGTQGVDLEGTLEAVGSSSTQLGGNVILGTGLITPWSAQTGTLNSQYGYESVDASDSGTLTLGARAVIDVSGGSAGGRSGGTVSFRAPLLGNGDVNITVDPAARIQGATAAGSVTIEPYAVWSTSDPVVNASQHFDGYIDPAGWYDSSGHLVNGSFSDQDGNAVASGSNLCPDPANCSYLTQDYFVPAAGAANTSHQTFYGYVNGDPAQGAGTLMGFIEAPGFSPSFLTRVAGITTIAGSGAFAVTPGVELDNPVSGGVNGGSIELLTNWNLGAGTLGANGAPVYAYRYNGAAPVITLRAGNSLGIDASITDGFYQYSPGPNFTVNPALYTCLTGQAACAQRTLTYPQTSSVLSAATGVTVSVNLGSGVMSYSLSGNADYVAFAPPAANQSTNYYSQYTSYEDTIESWSQAITTLGTTFPYTIAPNTIGSGAPALAAGQVYSSYASAYYTWLMSTYPSSATLQTLGTTPPPPQLPPSLSDYPAYLSAWSQYESWVNTHLDGSSFFSRSGSTFAYIFPPLPPPALQTGLAPAIDDGNLPANVPTLLNTAPLAYAGLSGGASASYRLVAGADLASANPLALAPASDFSSGDLAGGGNVTMGAHTAVLDETSERELVFPTTVRTGSGSISIAAAGDISLGDSVAPGVVYTAGVPVGGAGNSAAAGIFSTNTPLSIFGLAGSGEEFISAAPVNSQGAGNISLLAQSDITAVEGVFDNAAASLNGTAGEITGTAGTYIGQSWWQWMQTSNTATSSSINFSAFDQGVLSVGGNVNVAAGRNVSGFAASLPGNWHISSDASGNPVLTTYGGGNLTVSAGNDILSGSYFVAGGSGSLRAGGSIASGFTLPSTGGEVATVLGLQDGRIQVSARGGVDLGGIYDPSYLFVGFDSQGYSTASAVNVLAVGGSVQLDTLTSASAHGFFSFDYDTDPQFQGIFVLPATLTAAALQGDLNMQGSGELYPSAAGGLSLVAQGSVHLSDESASSSQLGVAPDTVLGLIDSAPQSMPSPLEPLSGQGGIVFSQHEATALHANDIVPVRIYSLTGSIVDGQLEPNGFYDRSLDVETDKETFIQARQDVVNLNFLGQNVHDSDVTRIIAGRDIYDTPLANENLGMGVVVPALVLGGPGTFDVEAGRNIGPLANQDEAVTRGYVVDTGQINIQVTTGIDAVGNLHNPDLPNQSATIDVLFGVGPGINTSGFIGKYIGDLQSTMPMGAYSQQLVAFMNNYQDGLSYAFSDGLKADHNPKANLSTAEAWAAFKALPAYIQNLFVEQIFDSVLTATALDYNNPASPNFHQYARGYTAINTLFPSSFGYTANNLTGGTNGSERTTTTGNLDLRNSTIQTQEGGNISIYGPGGEALLGSNNAPPYFVSSVGDILAGPNTIGVLTLEQGSINIFTDQTVELAQSRVFTEQGGDLLMWSSNGNIDAGNGLKSTSFVPPLQFTCDPYDYCVQQPAGEVTGAGIATLQTIPGAPPGDVELVTPRGTVDAGQAGIRVSGNLTIAALHVANIFNIQVQGKEVGVPSTLVDTNALITGNNAMAGVLSEMRGLLPVPADAETQVTVEVVGYGSPDEDQQKRMKDSSGSPPK